VVAAKFEITKDKAGKFRFHLKAPNGEIIAASQGYETKASAEKGVQAIKTTLLTPTWKITLGSRVGSRNYLTAVALRALSSRGRRG
jgi:uncharacterized protein YegP (UPF0339 family)